MGKLRRTILEPARETPVLAETDVLVAGGGPAGVAAGIAAARNSARALIVEDRECLGGMATSGMMNRLGPYHDEQKMIVGGIPWEVIQRLIAMNAAIAPVPCPHTDPDRYWIPFDPEALKHVLDLMVREAGVEVLFQTHVVSVVQDNDRLVGVIVESKSGRHAILAKMIIDATGDGDVAALAGAPYEKGRPEDGLMQPMTLLYKVHNVDRDRVKAALAAHKNEIFERAKAQGDVIPRYVGPGTDNLLRSDETYYNVDHVHSADGTSVRDLSRAVMEARDLIWQSVAFARKHVPGYECSYLCATASNLGVRESRRISGEYVLTGDDVLAGRKFADAVARYACWIDIHTVAPGKHKGHYASKGLAPGDYYDIPYRSLVPKRVENMLVAGRCFSATHEAFASARMIPCCMAMGQAAGTAAALAVEGNTPPRALDVARLQSALRRQGAMV